MRYRLGLLLCLLGVLGLALGCGASVAQTPAETVIEPDAGRQPILDAITSAQRSLDLTIYELTDSRILSGLEAAAGRGVAVRVMAEPLPGGHAVNDRALAELRNSGVQTHDSPPNFLLTHEKTLVIDNSSALIMSMNLVAETFTDTRDVATVDSDPNDVAEIEAVFNADWNGVPVTVSRPALVWSPDNARTRLTTLLSSATAEIDIYAEELVDQQIIALLTSEAQQGIRVELIMTDTGRDDDSRPGRAAIAAGGADVRLLRRPYIHAKVIIVDGSEAFLGSENLSAASLDRNRELGILTSDPSVVGQLKQTFEQDWQAAVPLSQQGDTAR
jgi:cardiolipin synthase A/B